MISIVMRWRINRRMYRATGEALFLRNRHYYAAIYAHMKRFKGYYWPQG